MDDPKANPLFERKWWACVFKFPVLTIVAQTMTPSKVSTAWGLSPFNVGLTDIPDPIDAMGKWVEFRFGVVATSPEEETPANERAMLGLLPPGRTRDSWNQRAIDRLLAGEKKEVVKADWRVEYERENNVNLDQTTNGEAKTWHMRVWEPYRRSQRSQRSK
jgi:hypothetical protein